jgi:hypothetical protein
MVSAGTAALASTCLRAPAGLPNLIKGQGHSEALHVRPGARFGSGRGYHRFDDSVFGQVGYMEMFGHGRRVLDAIDVLRSMYAPDGSEFRLPLLMNDFLEAGKLTHTNQSLVVAMLRMINKAESSGDSDPVWR